MKGFNEKKKKIGEIRLSLWEKYSLKNVEIFAYKHKLLNFWIIYMCEKSL